MLLEVPHFWGLPLLELELLRPEMQMAAAASQVAAAGDMSKAWGDRSVDFSAYVVRLGNYSYRKTRNLETGQKTLRS